MKKQVLSVLLASALLGAAAPAAAQNLAVVNGKPIAQAQFDYFIGQFVQSGRERTPELETHVKDELIRRAVYEQAALKDGLEKDKDFQQELALARQTLLIRALFLKEQKANPVTDAEIKAEYDRFVEANKGDEYHTAHILVETEEEAKAIIATLKKDPKKFEALAKEKSKDPGSATRGGDLGWANPATFVPEFSEAMVKLEKGKFTQEPVKTQFGWHILQLKDSRAAKPPALDAVKPQIEQALAEQKLADLQEKLYKAAKIN